MPNILHPGLVLRQALVADAEAMVEAMELDALQNFQFFVDKGRLPTVGEQAEYLLKTISSRHDKLWTIVADNCIIGTVGLHEIDWNNRSARMGIMLFGRASRGNGLGSWAMREVLTLGFNGATNLRKTYLIVFAENTVSIAKYSHMGFQFEARLQEHYRLKDEYHDMVQMRMFENEWNSRR